jgi:predicted DNA-binding transcriptional regulator YafY
MKHYTDLFTDMPAGLDRAILRVLSFYRGRANAIGRTDLMDAVHRSGFSTAHERQVREIIKQLRRAGHVIGSMPGEDGGYFMCDSIGEYREFKQKEYLAKILDMQETVFAMDKAARAQFGDGTHQEGLGI